MNEKIAEFTRQSGLDIILNEHAGEFGNGTVDSTYYPQVEKFAELIIQECVELGKELQTQTTTNGSDDYNLGREMGIEVFMNQIKKNFGIE